MKVQLFLFIYKSFKKGNSKNFNVSRLYYTKFYDFNPVGVLSARRHSFYYKLIAVSKFV